MASIRWFFVVSLAVLLFGSGVLSQFTTPTEIRNAAAGGFTGSGLVYSSFVGIWNTATETFQSNQWLNQYQSSLSNTLSPPLGLSANAPRFAPYDTNSIVVYISDTTPSPTYSGSGAYVFEATPNGAVSMLAYPDGIFTETNGVDVFTWAGDGKLWALGTDISRVGSLAVDKIATFDPAVGSWTSLAPYPPAVAPLRFAGFKAFLTLETSYGFPNPAYFFWTTGPTQTFYMWNGASWDSFPTQGTILDVFTFGGKLTIIGNSLRDSSARICHLLQKRGSAPGTWDCHDQNSVWPLDLYSAVQTSATSYYASTSYNDTWYGNVVQFTFDGTTADRPQTYAIVSDGGYFTSGTGDTSTDVNLFYVESTLYASGDFDSYVHLIKGDHQSPTTRSSRYYTGLNRIAKLDSSASPPQWIPVGGGSPSATVSGFWPMRNNNTAFLLYHGSSQVHLFNAQSNFLSLYGYVDKNDHPRWVTAGAGIPPHRYGSAAEQSVEDNIATCVEKIGRPNGIDKDSVVVGGTFDRIGSTVVNSIAAVAYDGSVKALDSGLVRTGPWTDSSTGNIVTGTFPGKVVLLGFSSGRYVWAYGEFSHSGGNTPLNNLAYYDFGGEGSAKWVSCGGGISYASSKVKALYAQEDTLYIGFSTSATLGQIETQSVAKYSMENNVWTALSAGPCQGKTVYSLIKFGKDLVAGGDFFPEGVTGTQYITRWDGSRWGRFTLRDRPQSCNGIADCQKLGSTPAELFVWKGALLSRGSSLQAYQGDSWQLFPNTLYPSSNFAQKLMVSVDGKFTYAPNSDMIFQNGYQAASLDVSTPYFSTVQLPEYTAGFSSPPVWYAGVDGLKPSLFLVGTFLALASLFSLF